MINISKTPQILNNEKGDLSVSEFLIGQRFSISVDEKEVKIEQDIPYNKKTFNKTLDMDKIFEILNNVYAFDMEKLQLAPTNKYTLECIHFNPDLMENHLQIYKGKGIAIVAVQLKTGNYIPQSKIQGFCHMIGIPVLAPLFVGSTDQIRDRFTALKSTTNFSFNKISGGLVIRNEPCQIDTKTSLAKIWYVEPDASVSVIDSSESPISMAHEFVFTTLQKDVIDSFIETTGLDPVKEKRVFKTTLFGFLKENFIHSFNDYKDRCIYYLGNDKPEGKFDNLVKKELIYYINNILCNSKKYIHRKK